MIYWELEAMKAFGYKWSEWIAEGPRVRGRLIAHEMHVSMREGYSYEQAAKKRGDKTTAPSGPQSDYDSLMRMMKL